MILKSNYTIKLQRLITKHHCSEYKFAFFPKKMSDGSIIWLEHYFQNKNWKSTFEKTIQFYSDQEKVLYFHRWTETQRWIK